MLKPGNIDVNHRPVIHNPDGSVSTIFSMTIPIDKNNKPTDDQHAVAYALVPSIANGKFLLPGAPKGNRFYSPDGRDITEALSDAARDYYAKTGENLGIFAPSRTSADGYRGQNADNYADHTHAWLPDKTSKKVFVTPMSKQVEPEDQP